MEGAYPTQDARREFFVRVLRALRNNPQFDSVALSSRFRMTFDGQGQYEVDGQKYIQDRDRPRGNYEFVSDNYFTTLGLKILEGRDFTIDDMDAKQPVAIVNSSFARKYWGNESAIGQRIRIYNPGDPQPWRTIVGVVPDTLMQGPFDQQTDGGGFYVPLLGASGPSVLYDHCSSAPGQRADTLGPALVGQWPTLIQIFRPYFAGTPAQIHNEIFAEEPDRRHVIRDLWHVAFILSAVGLYGW